MKKTVIMMVMMSALLLAFIPAKAQLEKGQKLIDVYYGYSLSKALFIGMIPSSAFNQQISGYGPVGARLEYMISDRVGLGLDVNIRHSEADYKREFYDSLLIVNNTYNYNYTVSQLRIMGKLNYHFVNNETSDFYGGFALGYKSVDRTLITNNPKEMSTKYDAIIPVAMRISMGYRYFVNDNIALNAEVGFGGGSFANVGLTYAF